MKISTTLFILILIAGMVLSCTDNSALVSIILAYSEF